MGWAGGLACAWKRDLESVILGIHTIIFTLLLHLVFKKRCAVGKRWEFLMHLCMFNVSILVLPPCTSFCIFKPPKCSYGSQPQEAWGRQQQKASPQNEPVESSPFFPLHIALSIPVLKLKRRDVVSLRARFCFKLSVWFLTASIVFPCKFFTSG